MRPLAYLRGSTPQRKLERAIAEGEATCLRTRQRTTANRSRVIHGQHCTCHVCTRSNG
jgi:hypothetical protein